MSFDWDSIKVVNNPDLKEIEASFKPLSELSGTASDPTVAVGPPTDQDEDGSGGGGTDDGGQPGGGVIDCQPPADYVPCPTQDCFAFEKYQAQLTDPDDVWSVLTADSGLVAPAVYPGFKQIDSTGAVQPATRNVKLLDAGSTHGPCASLDLYGYKVGDTSTAGSVHHVPDGVVETLGSITTNATYSGQITFYMTGRDPSGNIISTSTFNKFTIGTVQLSVYKDETNQSTGSGFLVVQAWNDTTAGTVTISIYDQELVIKTGSADMTGFYTLDWIASVTGNLTPTINCSATLSGDLEGDTFTLTNSRAGTPIGWTSADSYIKISTWDQHSFPKYFNGTPSPTNCPKVLYVGDTTKIPVEDFKLAVERSLQSYVTPADCVETWTRPAECPDCAKPAECFPDCGALTTALTNDTPGDTAIWGKTQAGGWSIPIVANPDDTASEFYANGIGGPSKMPAGDLTFIANIDNSYVRSNTNLATTSTATAGFASKQYLDCDSLYGENYNVIKAANASSVVAPEYDMGKFGGIFTSAVHDQASWDQLTGSHQGSFDYEVSVFIDFDTNVSNTLARLSSNWNPTFYMKKQASTQTTGLEAPIIDITWDGLTTYDYGTGNASVIDTSATGISGWYKLKVSGGWNIYPDDVTAGRPSVDHLRLSSTVVYEWVTPFGTFNSSKSQGVDSVSWIEAASWNGKPIMPSNQTLPGMGIYALGSAVIIHAATPNHLTTPDVKYWAQSRLVFKEPQECIDWVAPDGCPDEACPDDPCPCSCRGTTIDPLGCNPSIITGGLYDSVAVPRTNGVFENYDGSFGRVIEADALGVGVTTSTSINNGMAAVEIGGQLFHALSSRGIDGNWISTDSTYNLEGRPVSSGTSALFETSVLLGLANNVGGDTTLVDTWPTFPVTTPFNVTPYFQCHSLNPHLFAADGSSYGAIKNSTAVIARTGPSEFEIYDGSWKGVGVSTSRRVTVPAEVMKPTDNMFWVTVKTQWTFFDVGRAIDFNIPGASAPSQYAWGFTCTNTYYVNGFEIATGQGWTSNSAPPFADGAYYFYDIVPDSSISPQPGLTLKTQTNVAKPTSLTTIADSAIFNEAGAYELFAGFIDIGPGAADIPYTEQGANLKRIDPNNTPYKDCNCP